jgi:signal transduction histidine kinase
MELNPRGIAREQTYLNVPTKRRVKSARLVAAAFCAIAFPASTIPAVDSISALDPNIILTVIALGSVALTIGLGLIALGTFRTNRERLSEMARENTRLRERLGRYEALFAAEPGGVFIWAAGDADPEARGSRRETLAATLGGPDGLNLASMLESLTTSGEPFSVAVRGDDGKLYSAEGRAAGRATAVWLRELHHIDGFAKQGGGFSEMKAIKAERDAYAAALEALNIPAWRRGTDLTLEWVNSAYATAVGLPTPEAVLASQATLDRREPVLAREASDSGKPVREKRYVVLGGQRRALALVEAPVTGGVVGTAIDVTALEEAEQRLQRHMDAHEETLNKLTTAVAVFGNDQQLAFYNRAFARLWHFDETWLDTHPSDGEILERLRAQRRLPEQRDFQAWKRERLALYSNPSAAVDELWHLPDDMTIRVVCQPHPMGGLIFLYDDVTDQLTLESNFNTLITVQKETLDSLSEGVAVFGPDGKLQLSNAAFARIWAISQDRLEGKPHFQDVSDICRSLIGDAEEWTKISAMVTGLSTERRTEAGRFTRQDGAVLHYAVVPLPDGATLLSFVDVTDTVRAERRLIERNQALEAADRLKTEFVSHVSYQLRTPLASIIGFSEMLEQNFAGPLNDKQTAYLSSILQGATQLRALINDILDLAIIDAGAMELELTEVPIYETLNTVLPLVQERAEKAGVSLAFEAEPSVGTVIGDLRRIKQIAFNLLSNALNFTQTGGTITLSAKPEDAGVAIVVRDTGSGIPAEYQPKAFERFESRGLTGKRGAGLGLALVKSFVELHGGWVALESEHGKGTRVTCHLPRRPAQFRRAAE